MPLRRVLFTAVFLGSTSLVIAHDGGVAPDSHNPASANSLAKTALPRREIEVAYPGGAPGVELAGTLALPQGHGPFPAVLLIQGSGPSRRDEVINGRGLFPAISDSLANQGIAVLRFDKRGNGRSTGNFDTATTLDLAADVEAGFVFLRKRADIRADKIGLLGHSEGGLIAPIVATRQKSVAFMVLMAAPAVSGAEIMHKQGRLALMARGLSGARLEEAFSVQVEMINTIVSEQDSNKATPRLQDLNSRLTTLEGGPDQMIGAKLSALNSAWGRFFMSYDPRNALKHVTCPVLVLNGSADVQVDPEQNLNAIRTAFQGHRDVEIRELQGLGHAFRTVSKGAESGSTSNEAIAPIALEIIGPWIAKHVFDH
jgi:pimeloyl-ACP methyl ester carboxylesterase